MRGLAATLCFLPVTIMTACAEPRAVAIPSVESADSALAPGEAIYARGEFDSARVAFTAVLEEARLHADARREAHALTWLGLAAYRLGDYETARQEGELALSIKLREAMQADLFKSYNALGLLAWNEGRLMDGVALFENASAAADSQHNDLDHAKSANNMALVLLELGRFDDARRGFSQTRDIGRRAGDALIEGRALNNLGMLDIELGEARSAIASLAEARRLYRLAGDRTGEQNALGQLGSAYHALGEPGRALTMLDSALALARDQELRQEEASDLELIAAVHRDAGDYQRALRLYEEAARLDLEIGLTIEQGSNLRRVAEIHSALGRMDLARASLQRALAIHRAAGAPRDQLRDLLTLAEVVARSGDAVAAAQHLASAHKIADVLDTRVARADVALTSARIADRLGRSTTVLQLLAAAEDHLRGGNERWQAEALRARAFAALGQADSAVAAGRAAVAGVERLRMNFRAEQLRTSFTADNVAPYRDLIDVLLERNRVAEAFELADQARNRMLLAEFGERNQSATTPAALNLVARRTQQLQRIGALAHRLDALDDTPASERDSTTESQLSALRSALSEAQSEYETFLVHTAASRDAGVVLLGAGRTNAVAVQVALTPHEVLLEYLISADRLITFVVTKDAVRSLVVDIPSAQLAQRVRLARDLLGNPARAGGERPVLASLFEVLVRPAIRAGLIRPEDKLMLVPHSFLTYLPFAALFDGSAGKYLVEQYSVTHVPSAAALVVLRSRAAVNVQKVARFGRAFAPFTEQLPASFEEVRSVRSVTDGEAFLGRRATERRARTRLATGGAVHFATHGRLDARHPMFSRIEFANGNGDPGDDGRLEVHELLALRVRAPLVFLSGCETAVGLAGSTSFVQGEDYATLAQAFLFAGAASVVATLWKVSDRASADLAAGFYRYLRHNAPADALASAQRDLLASKRFGHPYFWAAYQVSGAPSVLAGEQK